MKVELTGLYSAKIFQVSSLLLLSIFAELLFIKIGEYSEIPWALIGTPLYIELFLLPLTFTLLICSVTPPIHQVALKALIPLITLLSLNALLFIIFSFLKLDDNLSWSWAAVFVPLWGILLCLTALLIFYWPGLTHPKVGMHRQAVLICMYLSMAIVTSALLLVKLIFNDIGWRYVFFGFWACILVHIFWDVWKRIYSQAEIVLLGYAMWQSFFIFIHIELFALHLFLIFVPTWSLFGYWFLIELYSYLGNKSY